ncbi:MAG: hypothetical protein IJW82_03785 [Clostridia bacterium]|nr:hypothetical protein [Clostridia bacterium]
MKIKKIVVITSITSIILSALLGILLAFEVIDLDGIMGTILLTLLVVGVGSLLSLNSVNLLERSFNILAVISLSLLGLSCLMALIQFWAKFDWGFYSQLTLVLAIFSVLFNFIVSYIIKLGKTKLPYQITTYVLMAIFDIFITIQIYSGKFLKGTVTKIFIVDIILALVGMALLAILSKKSLVDNVNDNYVKITKTEYESLKNRIAELEKELNSKN